MAYEAFCLHAVQRRTLEALIDKICWSRYDGYWVRVLEQPHARITTMPDQARGGNRKNPELRQRPVVGPRDQRSHGGKPGPSRWRTQSWEQARLVSQIASSQRR